jgi:hypothetical protein
VIHVALASAYATEADARAATGPALEPYRGIWVHPTPQRPRVHVFADLTDAELEARGWTREGA